MGHIQFNFFKKILKGVWLESAGINYIILEWILIVSTTTFQAHGIYGKFTGNVLALTQMQLITMLGLDEKSPAIKEIFSCLLGDTIPVEYTRILCQENNCRQLRLQFPLAFIGRAVCPVGGEGLSKGENGVNRYLSRYRVHFIRT